MAENVGNHLITLARSQRAWDRSERIRDRAWDGSKISCLFFVRMLCHLVGPTFERRELRGNVNICHWEDVILEIHGCCLYK